MRRFNTFAAAIILTASAGAVWSESHEAECALPYDVFEESVPHTDMAECPGSMEAGEDNFCRVAVLAEVATIFMFSYDSNCLVSSRSYYEDEFVLDIK